jgi:hypothetical protein
MIEGEHGDKCRILRISCDCGRFVMRPDPTSNLWVQVDTPGYGDGYHPQLVPYDKAQDEMDERIKYLVGVQILYLQDMANKGATKTLDKKQ